MKFKKKIIQVFKIFSITVISGIFLWFLMNLVIMGFGYILSIQEYYPSTGMWYCEELQLQLSFDKNNQSFIMINDELILCDHYSEKNSRTRYVDCWESDSMYFELGENILCFDSLSYNQNELILRECTSKKEYTFVLTKDNLNTYQPQCE